MIRVDVIGLSPAKVVPVGMFWDAKATAERRERKKRTVMLPSDILTGGGEGKRVAGRRGGGEGKGVAGRRGVLAYVLSNTKNCEKLFVEVCWVAGGCDTMRHIPTGAVSHQRRT